MFISWQLAIYNFVLFSHIMFYCRILRMRFFINYGTTNVFDVVIVFPVCRNGNFHVLGMRTILRNVLSSTLGKIKCQKNQWALSSINPTLWMMIGFLNSERYYLNYLSFEASIVDIDDSSMPYLKAWAKSNIWENCLKDHSCWTVYQYLSSWFKIFFARVKHSLSWF